MEIISVEHLKKYYGKVPNQTKAVNDISFSVQPANKKSRLK